MNEILQNKGLLLQAEIFQTREEFVTIAERTLECREKLVYYLGSMEILASMYDQEYERDYYIPTRIKRGIDVKMLCPATPLMLEYQATDSKEDRQTRALPPDIDMQHSVMTYDDTVIFFGKEKEPFALSIISASIADTMKKAFENMWHHSK